MSVFRRDSFCKAQKNVFAPLFLPPPPYFPYSPYSSTRLSRLCSQDPKKFTSLTANNIHMVPFNLYLLTYIVPVMNLQAS